MASAMPVLPLVGSTMTDSPGVMTPRCLGVVDHAPADTVLDRAAGVAGLELDGHAAGQPSPRRFRKTIGVSPIVSSTARRDFRHDCLHAGRAVPVCHAIRIFRTRLVAITHYCHALTAHYDWHAAGAGAQLAANRVRLGTSQSRQPFREERVPVNPWFWAWVSLVVVFALGEAVTGGLLDPAVGGRCRCRRLARRAQTAGLVAVDRVPRHIVCPDGARAAAHRPSARLAEGRPRRWDRPSRCSGIASAVSLAVIRRRVADHTSDSEGDSLVAQRLDRVELRGPPRRVVAEHDADGRRDADRKQHRERADGGLVSGERS